MRLPGNITTLNYVFFFVCSPDPAAVARARPYLRRYSVPDPKLNQFQTKFRRSASLPTRTKRPVLRNRCGTQSTTSHSSGNMSKGKTRILGQPISPTGIDRGMVILRYGWISTITTFGPSTDGLSKNSLKRCRNVT